MTPSALFIQQALELSAQALFICAPNPTVGCVIVSPQGEVIGQGHTQPVGGPHAEIMALRDAAAKGHDTQGATAYVTLEPCSHHGRTGPCCDALIAAGIGKVVASLADPNPKVSGQGFARLRAAGVDVDIGPGAAEAKALIIGFLSRMLRQTPWVRMKVAASLDGTTALDNGVSQWITSDPARIDGHAWRARAGAVLTGIGTVLQDNPRLNARDAQGLPMPRQPAIVVVDSRLQTPLDASIFIAGRACLIYAAADMVDIAEKKAALEARGATVVWLPNPQGKVDLAAMLRDLAAREINELHVEAGSKLNGSLLQAGLVDELLVYLAPKLLGQGWGMASWAPLSNLSEALALEFKSVDLVGPDLRVVAQLAGRAAF